MNLSRPGLDNVSFPKSPERNFRLLRRKAGRGGGAWLSSALGVGCPPFGRGLGFRVELRVLVVLHLGVSSWDSGIEDLGFILEFRVCAVLHCSAASWASNDHYQHDTTSRERVSISTIVNLRPQSSEAESSLTTYSQTLKARTIFLRSFRKPTYSPLETLPNQPPFPSFGQKRHFKSGTYDLSCHTRPQPYTLSP